MIKQVNLNSTLKPMDSQNKGLSPVLGGVIVDILNPSSGVEVPTIDTSSNDEESNNNIILLIIIVVIVLAAGGYAYLNKN